MTAISTIILKGCEISCARCSDHIVNFHQRAKYKIALFSLSSIQMFICKNTLSFQEIVTGISDAIHISYRYKRYYSLFIVSKFKDKSNNSNNYLSKLFVFFPERWIMTGFGLYPHHTVQKSFVVPLF